MSALLVGNRPMLHRRPGPDWHQPGPARAARRGRVCHSRIEPAGSASQGVAYVPGWALGSAGVRRCSGRVIWASARSVMQAGGMSARKAGWGRDLADQVGDALRETSAEVIEPRFSELATMDVRAKAAGELVTVADVDAERLLTRCLTDLLPRAAVVGEEACATDPTLLKGLGAVQAWLINPLDGTNNFVEGNHDWAVMVALCEEGRTVASWIWQPTSQTMYTAEAGGAATRNGQGVTVASRPPSQRGCEERSSPVSSPPTSQQPSTPAGTASAPQPPDGAAPGLTIRPWSTASRTSCCSGGPCSGTTIPGFCYS